MHPLVADSLQMTGEVLFMRARYPEARASLERTMKMRRTVLPPEHPAISATAVWLRDYTKLLESLSKLRLSMKDASLTRGTASAAVIQR